MAGREGGYIKLFRKLQGHPFWQEKRVFSKAEAWVDLLMEAAWKDHPVPYGMRVVNLRRGEVIHSQRTLADRWGWQLSRVNRFLKQLSDMGQIETRIEQKIHVLKISNYETYQDEPEKNETETGQKQEQNPEQERNGNRTEIEQPEEGKEYKQDKKPDREGENPVFEMEAKEIFELPEMQKIWNKCRSKKDSWKTYKSLLQAAKVSGAGVERFAAMMLEKFDAGMASPAGSAITAFRAGHAPTDKAMAKLKNYRFPQEERESDKSHGNEIIDHKYLLACRTFKSQKKEYWEKNGIHSARELMAHPEFKNLIEGKLQKEAAVN